MLLRLFPDTSCEFRTQRRRPDGAFSYTCKAWIFVDRGASEQRVQSARTANVSSFPWLLHSAIVWSRLSHALRRTAASKSYPIIKRYFSDSSCFSSLSRVATSTW